MSIERCSECPVCGGTHRSSTGVSNKKITKELWSGQSCLL